MLMLNLPCNPTGGTCDRAQLEDIAKFAVEKDLIVLSDEIYSELTFEGVHTSIASLPGMKERTIFLHGFSKAFAMTGWRIGYACGPATLIEAMMKVHQYSMLCASIIAQEAAIEALVRGEDEMKKMRDQYHRRRDFIVRRFNEIGLKCHLPRGSFYAFPGHLCDRAERKRFCHRPVADGKSRHRSRLSLRRKRQRLLPRVFRDQLRATHRSVQPHRAARAVAREEAVILAPPTA